LLEQITATKKDTCLKVKKVMAGGEGEPKGKKAYLD